MPDVIEDDRGTRVPPQNSTGGHQGTHDDSCCVHKVQLQAKDALLQEALKEIAKLEATTTETQERCYRAEAKARKKSQDLTTAKGKILANHYQMLALERGNSELKMELRTTVENLEKMDKELVDSERRYTIGKDKAVEWCNVYQALGVDLFYHITQLEVIVANECGRFFFGKNDVILKKKAANYIPIDEASKTMQDRLFNLFMERDANDDLPQGEETAVGNFRLAIEAPPTIDQTAESSSLLTSGIAQLINSTIQKIRLVEDNGSLEPTTPEKSNNRSDLEASPQSSSPQSKSEEGRPDSATSNDSEPASSICEDSVADSICEPKVEGAPTTEIPELGWLLGYNENPEEPFYPQYLQGAGMVDSPPVEVKHEVLSEDSPETEGPGVQYLLGFNPHPDEPFYPQYHQQNEEEHNELTKMTTSAMNETLKPLMGSTPALEDSVVSQEAQSPSGTEEEPPSTYDEPAAGPKLEWLLGYNPEPEEAFYPQYPQQDENERKQRSPIPVENGQGQIDATVPDEAPALEAKPEHPTTPTTLADSTPLAVDIPFADTSKASKEEVLVQTGNEDTASTASTEIEHQETSLKTREPVHIFTPQPQPTLPASPTPPPQASSIDISFGNTSEPFVAGAKPRMTRAQRREAAIKAQAETIASKNKKIEKVEEKEGGRFGKKESRQERRAAERKAAKKTVGKQAKRDLWRL